MDFPEVYYDREEDILSVQVSDKLNKESYRPCPGVVVTVDEDRDATLIEFIGPVREWFAPLIDALLPEAQKPGAAR